MNINKWYWLWETIRQTFFNIFCKHKELRMWSINEDRLEKYQKMERNFKLIEAERDMWYAISETYRSRLESCIKYRELINEE